MRADRQSKNCCLVSNCLSAEILTAVGYLKFVPTLSVECFGRSWGVDGGEVRDFENGIRCCLEAMCIINGVESKRWVRVFECLNDDSKGTPGEEMRGSYCRLRIGSNLGIAERVLILHKDPMPI